MISLPKELLIATKNEGKVREIIELLKNINSSLTVKSLSDLEIYEEYEETGTTFASNAIGKALYYNDFSPHSLTIADDSGLMVEALDDNPGVFSARYSGINSTDKKNNEKLLKDLLPYKNRNAKFCTVIAISINGKLVGKFEGEVRGIILTKPSGNNGFGYDPLFYYPPLKKTFAELSVEVKNNISHRATAIKKMIDYLKSLIS
jgi:XTP/dITP diphosphohydrolase